MTKTSYSKNIRSFLPLIYAAWADDVLSPSESEFIQAKIEELDYLSTAEKAQLKSYCLPMHPPSPETFESWKQLIISVDDKALAEKNLLGLGVAMQYTTAEATAPSQKTLEVLQEIENHLGIGFLDLPKSVSSKFTSKEEEDFPTEALTKLLHGDVDATIEKCKSLLQDPVFEKQTLRTKEGYRKQVLTWVKFLADQGLGALSYPKAFGGGDDIAAYAAVFETLGLHDLSLTVKFGVQFGLFGGSVAQLGTEKHHQKYLEAIGKAELLGCFAMTESNHGSNVRGLETTATYDASTNEIVIHTPHELAGKEYIGNALDSKIATVFAQLIVNGENQGVHAILVPLRDEAHELLTGIRVEDNDYKMGLNGVDNGKIWFNKVRVPVDNLLNRFGDIVNGKYVSAIESKNKRFFTMLGTLVGGRVCVPRAGLSATKKALHIAIKYAHQRKQFGPEDGAEIAIMNYPTHQKRLMPLLAKTYCLDFALQMLTDNFAHQKIEMREIESLAAGLKSYATWHATKSIQICREACGGKGYLAENQFTDLKADSDIFTTFEGDNTVLLQLVAKEVLRQFRNEFGKGSLMDILKFGWEEITTKIEQKNPLITNNTNQEHLRSSDFHLDAMRYRRRSKTINLVQRMRSLKKQQLTDHDIFLKCQNQFVSLAKAHVEFVVVETMSKVLAQKHTLETQDILNKISSLYTLHAIEKDLSWFLMDGYIENRKAKVIQREVEKLSAELSAVSSQLVDAFAIPDVLVEAPISKRL